MKQRPRIYYTEEQKALMWDRWQSGESEVSLPGSKTPGFPVIDWTVFERENPRILVSDPMLLGEGWNCWGYRANADMVVKVPKTGDWGDLENEIAFLDRHANGLPLPVPRPIAHRRASLASEHGYAVYTFVPGVELDTGALDAASAYRDLGGFLAALHKLPVTQPTLFVEEDAVFEYQSRLDCYGRSMSESF